MCDEGFEEKNRRHKQENKSACIRMNEEILMLSHEMNWNLNFWKEDEGEQLMKDILLSISKHETESLVCVGAVSGTQSKCGKAVLFLLF